MPPCPGHQPRWPRPAHHPKPDRLRSATNVEPYIRVDGTKVWNLMQLERQLRPDAYGTRRGGYLDRRRT